MYMTFSQGRRLRQHFSVAIRSKGIKSPSQLKYQLYMNMNCWSMNDCHTLHLGTDGRSLVYTDTTCNCQVLVCWRGCLNEDGLGENEYLLCGNHANEYIQLLDNKEITLKRHKQSECS